MITCDCIVSGNANKPKQHEADPHAKNCRIYTGRAIYVGVIVTCLVCHRHKKPIGRSQPLEADYCTDDCLGYRQAPVAGSLWPGETSEEFGYPVSADGTRKEYV